MRGFPSEPLHYTALDHLRTLLPYRCCLSMAEARRRDKFQTNPADRERKGFRQYDSWSQGKGRSKSGLKPGSYSVLCTIPKNYELKSCFILELYLRIRADVLTAGASPNSFSAVAKKRFVAFGRRWLCKCWDGPPVVRLGCRPNATKRLLAT